MNSPPADNHDGVHDARLFHDVEDPPTSPLFTIVIIRGDDFEVIFTAQTRHARFEGHEPPSRDLVSGRATDVGSADISNGIPYLRYILDGDNVGHKCGLSVSNFLGSERNCWMGGGGLWRYEMVQAGLHVVRAPSVWRQVGLIIAGGSRSRHEVI